MLTTEEKYGTLRTDEDIINLTLFTDHLDPELAFPGTDPQMGETGALDFCSWSHAPLNTTIPADRNFYIILYNYMKFVKNLTLRPT